MKVIYNKGQRTIKFQDGVKREEGKDIPNIKLLRPSCFSEILDEKVAANLIAMYGKELDSKAPTVSVSSAKLEKELESKDKELAAALAKIAKLEKKSK